MYIRVSLTLTIDIIAPSPGLETSHVTRHVRVAPTLVRALVMTAQLGHLGTQHHLNIEGRSSQVVLEDEDVTLSFIL